MKNIGDFRATARCPYGIARVSCGVFKISNHKCTTLSSRTVPIVWCDHQNSSRGKFLRVLHSALPARNRSGAKSRTGPVVGCDWGIMRYGCHPCLSWCCLLISGFFVLQWRVICYIRPIIIPLNVKWNWSYALFLYRRDFCCLKVWMWLTGCLPAVTSTGLNIVQNQWNRLYDIDKPITWNHNELYYKHNKAKNNTTWIF